MRLAALPRRRKTGRFCRPVFIGRPRGWRRGLAALLLAALPGLAGAGLFQLRDMNPLSLSSVVPLPGAAGVPAPDTWTANLSLQVSNTLNAVHAGGRHGEETLLIDGETAVADVTVLRGFGSGLAAGLHLPLVTYGGGVLDHFLDEYHRVLGLPRGQRPAAPRNRLRFLYRRNGRTLLDVDHSGGGVGDLSLLVVKRWRETAAGRVALHARIQIPLGQDDPLLGGQAWGYANWMVAERALHDRWRWSAWLGWGTQQDRRLLAGLHKGTVGYGGLALDWRWRPRWLLRAQLDARTALFRDSDLDLLGPSAVLTLGGELDLGGGWRLQGAVAEDLLVGAAPDVSLLLSLRWRRLRSAPATARFKHSSHPFPDAHGTRPWRTASTREGAPD